MSFVFAEKNHFLDGDQTIRTMSIFSDTKITFSEKFGNWSEITRKYIERYGMVKSLILSPTCCISFAGNNIFYVTKLLDHFANQGSFSEEYLCEKAFEIHCNALPNDIEFIICYIVNEEHHIVCIKNGKMECDCANAWIGSPKTFYELQRCRSEKMENNATNLHVTSADLFREAIRLTKDESVGKDIFIHTFVSSLTNEFVYAYRLESFSEAQRLIPPGSNIPIIGTVAEGAFSVEYEETAENVIINVLQANISILYTKKYRLDQFDVDNPNTKYFLLPIPCRTSSGQVLTLQTN